MTAVLRGRKESGYRTATPISCPHCARPFHMAGQVSADKSGPHIALWPVETKPGEYTEAEVERIRNGPVGNTGVVLPQPPGNVKLVDDPVPDFSGER